MRKRPALPVSTPATRPPRAGVPRWAIRASLQPVGGTERLRGWVEVFSTTGMFMRTENWLPDGAEVRIEWMARLEDRPVRIKLTGWVVTAGEGGIAVQFDGRSVRATPDLEQLLRTYLPQKTET